MKRVLDHIDQHLDEDLDLDAVSSVAAFSKFPFHRQFAATFGMSAHRYVQLARIKRATDGLMSEDARSVTDIALDAATRPPTPSPAPFANVWASRPQRFENPRTGGRGSRPLAPSI